MALLNIDSGLELRITNGKGLLYLNDAVIPGQVNSTIRFERGSHGTMDVELSMLGVRVVHVDQPKPKAHNHPLPEGFTAHDGSPWPKGLASNQVVRVQYGTGSIEPESDSEANPFTVGMWAEGEDNAWEWSTEVTGHHIIAYKVVNK